MTDHYGVLAGRLRAREAQETPIPDVEVPAEDELHWDKQAQAWLIKRTETYTVYVIPMIFNDRVVIEGPEYNGTYEHGWCYDKGGAAFAAALVWNPDLEDTPVGWKKQATPGQRTAPGRRE